MRQKAGIMAPDLVTIHDDKGVRAHPWHKVGTSRTPVDVFSVYVAGGPRYRLNGKYYRFKTPIAILLPAGSDDCDLQEGAVDGTCALFHGNGLVRSQPPSKAIVSFNTEKLIVPVLKEISDADAKRIVSILFEARSVTGTDLIAKLKKVAYLYQALSEYCYAPSRTGASATHREAVRLRELVQAWAFENTSMEKIYETLDLSSGHAETLFRKSFGITPVAYRMRLRMQYARELLVSSQLNVSQVAYKTGFTDPLHFSRVFRRAFGVPPSGLIKDYDVSRKKAQYNTL